MLKTCPGMLGSIRKLRVTLVGLQVNYTRSSYSGICSQTLLVPSEVCIMLLHLSGSESHRPQPQMGRFVIEISESSTKGLVEHHNASLIQCRHLIRTSISTLNVRNLDYRKLTLEDTMGKSHQGHICRLWRKNTRDKSAMVPRTPTSHPTTASTSVTSGTRRTRHKFRRTSAATVLASLCCYEHTKGYFCSAQLVFWKPMLQLPVRRRQRVIIPNYTIPAYLTRLPN